MKSASVGLAAHIAGNLTDLARCLRIQRLDGLTIGFTTHDRDLTFGGVTYRASPGMQPTALAAKADMSVPNAEVELLLDDDAITPEDVRVGLWDHAEWRTFIVCWSDLSRGEIKLGRGRLGEITPDDTGLARGELRGLAQALQQTIGELTSPECREDLGGPRCKIPLRPALVSRGAAYAVGQFARVVLSDVEIGSFQEGCLIFECTTAGTTGGSDPTWNTTVDATTTDGTVTWTARAAWTRPATVESALSREEVVLEDNPGISGYADGWFDGGVLTVETGPNAGISREVVGWTQSTRTLHLFLPLRYPLEPGDVIRVSPGCDKRHATCIGKYHNRLNFRGEPFLRGLDAVIGTAT